MPIASNFLVSAHGAGIFKTVYDGRCRIKFIIISDVVSVADTEPHKFGGLCFEPQSNSFREI